MDADWNDLRRFVVLFEVFHGLESIVKLHWQLLEHSFVDEHVVDLPITAQIGR